MHDAAAVPVSGGVGLRMAWNSDQIFLPTRIWSKTVSRRTLEARSSSVGRVREFCRSASVRIICECGGEVGMSACVQS